MSAFQARDRVPDLMPVPPTDWLGQARQLRLPVEVVYSDCWPSKGEALKHEAAIKKLSRAQKEALIRRGTVVLPK